MARRSSAKSLRSTKTNAPSRSRSQKSQNSLEGSPTKIDYRKKKKKKNGYQLILTSLLEDLDEIHAHFLCSIAQMLAMEAASPTCERHAFFCGLSGSSQKEFVSQLINPRALPLVTRSK